MKRGHVLDFTDVSFGRMFNRHGIDIHGADYQIYGTSHVDKMRAFWEKASDALVSRVLSEMLEAAEALLDPVQLENSYDSFTECMEIVDRLARVSPERIFKPDQEFLDGGLKIPSIQNLPVEPEVLEIIQDRLKEIQICLLYGAHLAAILLCGSVLEAVLFGVAHKEPEKFNRSKSSPKKGDKVKAFREWKLAELIDVAQDTGYLQSDLRMPSHFLRDFRNYIHPNQQLRSRFSPNEHTAKVCFQVLVAALADVTANAEPAVEFRGPPDAMTLSQQEFEATINDDTKDIDEASLRYSGTMHEPTVQGKMLI